MVDRGTAFLISLITSVFVAIVTNLVFYFLIVPTIEEKKLISLKEKTKTTTVEVPDLRGIFPSQAKILLSQINLFLVLEGEVESKEYPEGTIAEQRPLAGSYVNEGSEIYVKIAKTKKIEYVRIPVLKGLDLSSAQKILLEQGFVIEAVEEIESTEISEGHVVKTYPEGGSEVPKGSAIKIFVSKAEKTVIVPNLIGKYLSQAISILEREGLKAGKIKKELSAEYPENKVIDQHPKPGTKVKKNSPVDITIATVKEDIY
ncbi:MAG: PASTA domain-containing protein [Candidatus Hydrothermales bacterium]